MAPSIGQLLALAGLAGVVAWVTSARHPRHWRRAVVASTTAALAASLTVLIRGETWDWRTSFRLGGEFVHLGLDGLGAWFLAMVALLGGCGAVYSGSYWTDREHPASAPRSRAWWMTLLVFLALVLLARNGLHFLLAWEVFAVAAYFLITVDGRRAEVREAGWLYLAASHTGTLALFAFFALLAARTGSWELKPMRQSPELGVLLWPALFGFGIKAGVFPLHVWLPSAHAGAPSHVSAILSGVAIKMGVYGIVRFGSWLPVPPAVAWTVAIGGAASAVLGVVFALGQHDLKRLLAYHSVENIGIIAMGVGCALVWIEKGRPELGVWAMAGGLLHVWNHGIFKALLFLGAGSVLHATGTREMSRLGGLWRTMPWTTSLFALGAAAISGLPPLNGFVSEWLIYLGLFDALETAGPASAAAVVGIVLLAMTGALALACFVKVCGVVFLGSARSPAAVDAREGDRLMRGPMVILGTACVAIGGLPILVWPMLRSALAAWHEGWAGWSEPESLRSLGAFHLALALAGIAAAVVLRRRWNRLAPRRIPTWDCGYAAPSPRMQYSPGSFARTIVEWFAWILRPQLHARLPEGPFPTRADHHEHVPETVLDHVIAPWARRVMRVSAWVRRFQHGRVQAYLFYLVVGLSVLAVLTTLGSP